MTGPVRTAPPTRPPVEQQPRRPPNAWILYRSDRVREMPPPIPGQVRTQSDVSKAISEQWRNESEATRSEYERRAEIKKAEHHRLYPDYRFQPKSKEQKERQRLEKKQEKERQPKRTRTRAAVPTVAQKTSNYSQPLPNPPLNPSYNPSYYPEARFGPAGPSPPLSAAASPSENDSCSELQGGELQISHTSPYPARSRAPSPSTVPSSSCDANSTTSHSKPNLGFLKTPPLPSDPNQWPQLDASPPSSSSSNAMTPSVSLWDSYSTPQMPGNDLTTSNFVSFDLQPIALQNVRNWISEPGAFDEAMQALLSATGDPSIFQLDNFDASALTANPSGEIEVSMGQPAPYAFDSNFIPDFSGFNFAESQTFTANSILPTDGAAYYTSLFSGNNTIYSSLDRDNYNVDDFINFDGVPNSISTASPADIPSQHLDQTSETLESTPYLPPAGAAHSSTRRVAGSWKPSFAIPNSPIEVGPPRSWGVPAI